MKRQQQYEADGRSLPITKQALFSAIWIFAVLNYLYCDVLSLMDSGLLKQYLAGKINGMQVNQGFLLAAGVLMEISISMVLLSRILPYRWNRGANIVAGLITTLVQVATLFMEPTGYYLFFSTFEIAATASVVVLAIRWSKESETLRSTSQAQPSS